MLSVCSVVKLAARRRDLVARLALADYGGNSELPGVGQRQGQVTEANLCGPGEGGTVEPDGRRSPRKPDHLDVAPADASRACAQGLHHRLFGREPARKLRGPAPTVFQLTGGINATEEALAVLLGDSLNAPYLDDVDARYEHEARSASQSGGIEHLGDPAFPADGHDVNTLARVPDLPDDPSGDTHAGLSFALGVV